LKWFDLAGHFTLYGLWGYFFSAAYPTTLFEIGRFKVAQGIIFSTCIAIAEELLQLLSPNRSFTFSDMAFSTLGIFCAAVYLNFKSKPDFQS